MRSRRSRPSSIRTGDVRKPCTQCGRSFAPEAWGALDLVDRITSERVRAFVTSWPDAEVVEVRTCDCGHALARRVEGGGRADDVPEALEMRR